MTTLTKVMRPHKIAFFNAEQYSIWVKKELPKFIATYPDFNYTRMTDVKTGHTYVFYRTRRVRKEARQ